jgi:hypothetical protein
MRSQQLVAKLTARSRKTTQRHNEKDGKTQFLCLVTKSRENMKLEFLIETIS